MKSFILLFQCNDAKGIVAGISAFILKFDGNIVTADQHSTDPEGGHFFMRVEFIIDDTRHSLKDLKDDFLPIVRKFNATADIYNKHQLLNMGILVSKADHCLIDLLYLWRSKELLVNIPFVISNCNQHRDLVEQFKIPFYFMPAKKDNKMEEQILKIAAETDFLVLARYMQVLTPGFLKSYNKDIINIHHGFLPSFKGSDPYRQALEGGVKVIGSTAHFVNENLDEGPIISQAVEYVTHKDDLENLLSKGRNLEKKALSDAIRSYIDYRIIKYGNKTIVF